MIVPFLLASLARHADKAYDTSGFVAAMREQGVTPHVAQNTTKRRSAIDRRTTRHGGYGASQILRKLVEHPFGWLKSAAGLWQVKSRGRDRVDLNFTFGMAVFNLVRLKPALDTSLSTRLLLVMRAKCYEIHTFQNESERLLSVIRASIRRATDNGQE